LRLRASFRRIKLASRQQQQIAMPALAALAMPPGTGYFLWIQDGRGPLASVLQQQLQHQQVLPRHLTKEL
jgi:hypothetical protein